VRVERHAARDLGDDHRLEEGGREGGPTTRREGGQTTRREGGQTTRRGEGGPTTRREGGGPTTRRRRTNEP